MDSRLIKGLKGKDLGNFQYEFHNSRVVKRLRDIIQDMYDSVDAQSKSLESFDKAGGAWPYKRAYLDGELKRLTQILNLINEKEVDHDRRNKTE